MESLSIPVRIRIIFVTILLICIIFPLLFLFCIPIFFLRYVTNLLKKLLRPDLGKMLSSHSALLVGQKTVIVVSITLDGHLDLETLQQNFMNNVLYGGQNGTCLHPELIQYPSTWLGFASWVPQRNFSVEEHIKHYDGPVTFDLFTESVSITIQSDLMERPFIPRKSPWEIYLFNKCHLEDDLDLDPETPKTVIMVRIHHCLADGFSLLKLFCKIGNVDPEKIKPPIPQSRKRNLASTFLYCLTFPLRVPYDLAVALVTRTDPHGPWHAPPSKLDVEVGTGITHKVPMSRIKLIRDQYKTTTTAVILTTISGALRRIMMESGKGLPESIVMYTLLPLPGHPDKLRNHSTAMTMSLPTGTENPVKRLRLIEREMESIRYSTFPWTLAVFHKGMGSLYLSMTKWIFKSRGISMLLSNFPGPAPGTKFLNLPILDLGFRGGVLGIGIGSFAVTCNGNLRILFTINEGILSDAESYASRLAEYALIEFDKLSTDHGMV